ncbi:hypothetical protein [Metasolibacillus sp. FSL K6-0083]|uniref:hypothetical protein n=1 Tax=Metasolibacillus sp. FSL K6-0083 TaxID=2921416 RepID=UPI00315B09D9
MAIFVKLISIATIFFSVVAGLILYYWLSSSNKEEKKQQPEEVINFLMNFIIFMWIGKIIMNFPLFIKDPLAVLAYPADSTSFYFAIIGSILRLVYQRKKIQLPIFIAALLPVILAASFMFEFIQFLQDSNLYSLVNMIFYMFLLSIFYYLNERMPALILFLILLMSWFVGTMMMFFTQPYVLFLGYLLSLPFILIFFLFNVGVLIYIQIKR